MLTWTGHWMGEVPIRRHAVRATVRVHAVAEFASRKVLAILSCVPNTSSPLEVLFSRRVCRDRVHDVYRTGASRL